MQQINKHPLSIERFLNWPVWPFFVPVLLWVLFLSNQPGAHSWPIYFSLTLRLTLEISPILLFKHFATQFSPKVHGALWLLVFAVYPALLIWIAQTQLRSIEDFAFIWFIEATMLFNAWWNNKKRKQLKFAPTLDNVLFTTTVIFSLVMALLFTSTADAINHQPVEFKIDVGLLIEQWQAFLANWFSFFVIYSLMFSYYYVNRHFLVNKILARHGVINYLWSSALYVLISFPVFSQLVLWLPIHWDIIYYDDLQIHFESSTLLASGNHDPFDYLNGRLGGILVAISTPVILAFEWQQKSQQLVELEKQNIQSELLLLQQQINPHFLFNTLNNLYALCLTKNENAPKLVLQLANLLRFVVYQGNKDWVALSDEVQYLQDYLNLQQVRVSKKCQFDVSFPADVDGQIAPLLLVMLVENAIKHGIEPSNSTAWLKIDLTVKDNQIIFYCGNSIDESYLPEQSGIGLENLRRRLSLIYPQQHQLQIRAEQDAYHVTLTLECQ